MDASIAVIGMGGIFPRSNTLNQYWDAIIHGTKTYSEVNPNRWDPSIFYSTSPANKWASASKICGMVDGFDFPFEKYKIPPSVLKNIDHSILWLIELTNNLLGDLPNPLTEYQKEHCGVVLGGLNFEKTLHQSSRVGFDLFLNHLVESLQSEQLPLSTVHTITDSLTQRYLETYGENDDSASFINNITNMATSLLCSIYGLGGFNFVVDAACASSLTSIDIICKALNKRDIEVGIAGGFEGNLKEDLFIGFSNINAMSPTHCHPFDQSANGIVLGEGAGLVLLKRLEDALSNNDPILGVIQGIGCSSDGKGKAIFSPDKRGILQSIQMAFEQADWEPTSLDYIEAHATGTRLGDSVEYSALAEFFKDASRDKPIYIGSVKELIGHLRGAAGIAGIIKTLLAMNQETIPPIASFQTYNESILEKNPILAISNKALPWNIEPAGNRRAMVCASGFGGINYHVLIEQFPSKKPLHPKGNSKKGQPDLPKPQDTPEYAIVDASCILPTVRSIDEFWERYEHQTPIFSKNRFIKTNKLIRSIHGFQSFVLKKGADYKGFSEEEIGEIEPFNLDFKTFKLPPNDQKFLDASQLYGLELTNHLSYLRTVAEKNGNQKTGTVIGTMVNQQSLIMSVAYGFRLYTHFLQGNPVFSQLDPSQQERIINSIKENMNIDYYQPAESTLPGTMNNVISGRISKFFDLRGTNFTVDASESSFPAALQAATYYLDSGQCDQMLVGSIQANLFLSNQIYLNQIHSYHLNRNYVLEKRHHTPLSEGGAFFILRRLEDAKRDNNPILAIISSIQGSSDSKRNSITKYHYTDIYRSMKRSLNQVSDSKRNIQIFSVYGLNSKKDDLALQVIQSYFEIMPENSKSFSLSCLEQQFGHLLSASGSLSLLALMMYFKTKKVPFLKLDPVVSKAIQKRFPKVKILNKETTHHLSESSIQCGMLSSDLWGSNYFILVRNS